MRVSPFVSMLGVLSIILALSLPAAPVQAEASFEADEITAPGPNGNLAATLLLPVKGKPPYNTVLILPGSGPTDRDGNTPSGVAASAYRLLAEGLAEHGIASVRIDKRGLGGSAAAADGNDVTLERYADDVESWLAVIANTPELSGDVWLAGHSEGALIAMVAAGRKIPDLQALVLLSSPGRKLGIVLREQLADNPATVPFIGEAFAAIETLERGGSVDPDTLHESLRALFNAPAQRFLANLVRFDPAATLQALAQHEDPLPVLIIHGDRDIQVSTEDVRALAQARPDAELVVIADMNHVLKSVASDDRSANLAAYSNPDLPIVRHLVDTVAEFISSASQLR